jgi:hypothetical protein
MPKAKRDLKAKGLKAEGSSAAEMPSRVRMNDFLASKSLQKHERHSKKKQLRKEEKKGSMPSSNNGILMSELEMGLKDRASGEGDKNVNIKAAANEVKTNKMKRQVAIREVGRMKLVLEHPDFMANPWGSVHNHLHHVRTNRALGV